MINKSSFWGISLVRRRTRRILVIAYWAAVFLVTSVDGAINFWSPGWRNHFWITAIWTVCFALLGSFLGGLGTGGPVRNFEGRRPQKPNLIDNTLRTLINPADVGWQREDGPLDERDIRLRNAAHYEAYRAIKFIFLVGFLAFILLGTVLQRYKTLTEPVFLVLFLIAMNLPQTLILWYEPDMEQFDSQESAN